MNQQQRDYLIRKIDKTFTDQTEALEESVPEEPLLNNYIIGAFLDNSIKILDSKVIKANLKKVVLALGKDEFVEDAYRDEKAFIKITPSDIMEMPAVYAEEHGKWEVIKKGIDEKIKALHSQKESLILRIQIGSNAVLDKLITQVDSLGDLNLFSDKLNLIAGGADMKQLVDKNK